MKNFSVMCTFGFGKKNGRPMASPSRYTSKSALTNLCASGR